ncbi:hypothetical protein [Streptomyces pactum]|uniref:hypothetical protein n=1 Tax=Streptomyces pactum TaxID=68249 RepID=UPI000AEA424B|nr:hypothetical protein [Streptomyces pactum]
MTYDGGLPYEECKRAQRLAPRHDRAPLSPGFGMPAFHPAHPPKPVPAPSPVPSPAPSPSPSPSPEPSPSPSPSPEPSPSPSLSPSLAPAPAPRRKSRPRPYVTPDGAAVSGLLTVVCVATLLVTVTVAAWPRP